MLLKSDIAGALESSPEESLFDLLEKANPELIRQFRDLRAKLSPSKEVFSKLIQWLTSQGEEVMPPESESDWRGFAEVSFWFGHLNIEQCRLGEGLDIGKSIRILPLHAIAELLLGLAMGQPDLYRHVMERHCDVILERFRRETNTVWIEEVDNAACAHFIVDIGLLRRKEENAQHEQGLINMLNDEAVRRAELLRSLLPARAAYGAQGYGHKISPVDYDYDPTTKIGMKPDALPVDWLVRVNATFRNLAIWNRRPDGWNSYTEEIIAIRETVTSALSALVKGLTAYFGKNKSTIILDWKLPSEHWEKAANATRRIPQLPKTAVDEWGFTSDGQRGKGSEDSATRLPTSIGSSVLLRQYKPFLKASRDYFSYLNNFFTQSNLVLCQCQVKKGQKREFKMPHLWED